MKAIVVVAAAVVLLAPAAGAQQRVIDTEAGQVQVETIAEGLSHPWAVEFLPDGRMLVTERPGRLRILDAEHNLSEPLSGVPEVFAQRQGGLLDVAIDPNFESNRLVYLSYAEPGQGGATTAVARGVLGDGGLDDVEVIFRQEPRIGGGAHFGSRLVFGADGRLFATLGERFQFDPAQDLSNHLGTIVRIEPDGSVPDDNPFVGQDGALPEIWSYGHRNIQGATLHPETGALWVAEMGPRGGDEINVAEAGENYGWPEVSWGSHYDGRPIPDPPERPEFARSLFQWTPSIAPSGMVFYTGTLFPDWQGDILVGALAGQALIRLEAQAQQVSEAERMDMGARIRDVAQGPDGAVYLVTDQDNGKIWRLTPQEKAD